MKPQELILLASLHLEGRAEGPLTWHLGGLWTYTVISLLVTIEELRSFLFNKCLRVRIFSLRSQLVTLFKDLNQIKNKTFAKYTETSS